jgi:hypothetical protein
MTSEALMTANTSSPFRRAIDRFVRNR